MHIALWITIAIFFTGTVWGLPSGAEILRKVDANYKSHGDIRAKVCFTQQRSGQGTRSVESVFYSRDRDNAFLIVITGPESDRGNGYLRVNDNFWMYRRNTRNFQHISRNESIAGTDARGDDFEYRKLGDQYRVDTSTSGVELIDTNTLGKFPVYCLELSARVNDVDFPRKKLWVRSDNYLIIKDASFSGAGKLLQTVYYLKYTEVAGSFVPVKQIYIDEFEKGNKSIVETLEIKTDKLNDAIFTKAFLENVSK